MRLLKCFVGMLLIHLLANSSYASTVPNHPAATGEARVLHRDTISHLTFLTQLTPAKYKALTGKKMKLKDRIMLRYLAWATKHGIGLDGAPTEKQKRQARLSLIFGASSLVLVFIPYAAIVAIPLAIAGLVLGINSLKGNNNTEGILGVVFSGTLLFLAILAIILFAIFFAGGIY